VHPGIEDNVEDVLASVDVEGEERGAGVVPADDAGCSACVTRCPESVGKLEPGRVGDRDAAKLRCPGLQRFALVLTPLAP
jgi:NAD-dependent dihydropyrimidine dehydrogenase PreA subunit